MAANNLGKYDKKRMLGRGTFGEAWLVVSKSSGRFYVMKEMVTGSWENKDKEQSMNEINILASCNHVNIVRYAGAYIIHKSLVTERILIIMEFADAGDLAIAIKRQREQQQLISEAQVLSFFVQIAFGLQYIHKKNILHRDLKTQNIFLTTQNIIKIGDFGISKALNHTLDLATTAIGTPHYLSPEICRRNPYNHKSDMWSLGCVLYEMCTLQLAFPADNFINLVQSICRGSYKPISSHYSSKVADLVQVLLRPVPERRPSAEQLLTCSKLEKDVKIYLAYVNNLKGQTQNKQSRSSQSSADGGYGSGNIEAR
jgi:NIMA (never in mitosis gene a)-related kinase